MQVCQHRRRGAICVEFVASASPGCELTVIKRPRCWRQSGPGILLVLADAASIHGGNPWQHPGPARPHGNLSISQRFITVTLKPRSNTALALAVILGGRA